MKGPPLPAPRFATINDALAAAADSEHGVVFVDLHEREERLSWRELRARCLRAAAAFAALGVKPGDRVAIVLATGPAFFVAFLGAQHAGAIPVPLYPPVRLGRIDEYHETTRRMLERVGARLLLTDSRIRRLLGRTVEGATLPLGCRTVEEVFAHAEGELDAKVDPGSLALIQFSSGTTVAPKPVALTHANVIAQFAALHALMPYPDEKARIGVLWLPLYHDMGLIGSLLAMYYPATIVLIPPELFLARPALWLRAISRHRAVLSTAPSFAYALCARRIRERELEGVDLSSWRWALDGAEPVSASVGHRFAERFARFGFDARALTAVYGLSEATLATSFAPLGVGLRTVAVGSREVVSVGRPVPGAEIELREGRIFVRGPSVSNSYFGEPARPDGWLDTGDLGFVENGELYVSGRAKDVVIVRGANHAPEEFEDCLEELPGMRPGCAVALGLPTADGEELLILAEHAAGEHDPALADRIRRAVLAGTGVRPFAVEILAPGTLPRTSSGKKRRQEALARYLDGELSAPRPVTPARLAVEVARSGIAYARRRWNRGR
jgi:acyl-CoA synthetase (AMP-forming)/AMP-acid ligase II